jgi:hypothetical protein
MDTQALTSSSIGLGALGTCEVEEVEGDPILPLSLQHSRKFMLVTANIGNIRAKTPLVAASSLAPHAAAQ